MDRFFFCYLYFSILGCFLCSVAHFPTLARDSVYAPFWYERCAAEGFQRLHTCSWHTKWLSWVHSCKLWSQLSPVCLLACQPTPPFWQGVGAEVTYPSCASCSMFAGFILFLFMHVLWPIPQSEFRMIAMKKICGIQKAYLLYIIKKAIKDKR